MDGSATTQATVTLAGTDGVVISDGDTMTQALVSDFDTYGISTSQTLTNKSIDADNNTITNINASELGVTAGTVTASKAVVVDANKQVDAMHFSGDVGIGTDSPLSQFHVEGATTGEMTIGQYSGGYLSGNDVGALKFYGWDNSGGGAGKGDISKITGTWGDDNGDGQSIAGSTTEGGRLEFWTGKRASGDSPPTLTEKMVIDQNGNVGIGTTSPDANTKLDVAGVIRASGGIQPNGNAYSASEVLDDYEEGTWTPTGTNIEVGAGTYGRYRKVGSLVHIECKVTWDGAGGAIGGLPFSGNSSCFVCLPGGVNWAGSNTMLTFLNSATTLVGYSSGDNAVRAQPIVTAATDHVWITGTYTT
jgi:hypothetical protein